jgi:hypothetical protein
VQKTVDAQREIATLWVELLTSLSGTIREQTEKVSHLVAEQADRIGDLVAGQAAKAEQSPTSRPTGRGCAGHGGQRPPWQRAAPEPS